MDQALTAILVCALLLFWLPVPRLIIAILTIVAMLLGSYAGLLSPLALFILIILFFISALYFKGTRPLLLALTLALVAWIISKNWIPGFYNWKAVPNIRLSKDCCPYNLLFNYDKAFVGIALLLFLAPLKPVELVKRLKQQWILVLSCIAVLLGSSLAFSYVHFDPKMTWFAPLFLVNNFFFVCMPEEALFRGFIQKELSSRPWAALASSSLLFGLYHAHFGALMVLFATIAGLFYGLIWMKTKRLEASIGLHFLVNITHFFFFSYPRAYG